MKKLFLLFLLSPLVLLAQTTASATVNVKLNPVMSITVNQPTVNIDILTQDDYILGKTVSMPNHVTTFATQGYTVSVKTLDTNFNGPTDTLDLGILTINGSSNFPQANYTPVVLSNTGGQLIESSIGGGQKNHNINYTVKGDLWDKAMETYTANVMYTITAN